MATARIVHSYRFVSLWALVFFFSTAQPNWAQTIEALAQTPITFQQQTVTVVGEVHNVVTRYGGNPYTTFELRDAKNAILPVFVWGAPTFKEGQFCQVTGTFVLEKILSVYALKRGIEATKIEKAAETETQMASTIFKKKKNLGIRGARGFYLPQ